MKIVYSMNWYHPEYGGPFNSVTGLAEAVQGLGQDVSILSTDSKFLPAQDPPTHMRLDTIPCHFIPGIRVMWMPKGKTLVRSSLNRIKPEIIHDNGMWLSLNHHVARWSNQNDCPRILSPRGCLDPWAMNYRNWKKQIALSLYQKKSLESVTCFHAASELEAESIRKMGLTQPIAVIPNGVDIPEWVVEDSRWEIEDSKRMQNSEETEDGKRTANFELPTPNSLPRSGTRYALFMGRLHPIKNLPTLLRAWAEVKPKDWILRLVGSDEVGHRDELETLAAELGIAKQVEFLGPIYGREKEELFRTSELAFLVSKSENFGIAAAEALAAGIPVIASKTTPWSCTQEEQMGWWVEGTIEGVSRAILSAINLDPKEKLLMQKNARRYAENTFGWLSIAGRFDELYQWVLGRAPQPKFVQCI